MLRTIRSLLEDGLVEVGDIPAPGDPGFKPWPGTLDEVMAGLTTASSDATTTRSWEYTIWLNLTSRVSKPRTLVSATRPIERFTERLEPQVIMRPTA